MEIADRLVPYTPHLLSFLLAVAGKGAPQTLPPLPVRPPSPPNGDAAARGPSPPLIGEPLDGALLDWVQDATRNATTNDAAGWLIDVDEAEGLGIVAALRTTPDEDLGPLWDRLARERAELAPVIAWFRAWDRRAETLTAVRALSRPVAPAADALAVG